MHKKRDCKLGCICTTCMLRAYDDYFNDPDSDPEVMEIIMETVLEEDEYLDMVPAFLEEL